MSRELWRDKYRPTTLGDYVWSDPNLRVQAEKWIEDRATPNLILGGPPGTGKTSLSRMLLSEIGIPKADILEINASGAARKGDALEGLLDQFCTTYAMNDTDLRYVLLDEADKMSDKVQGYLRKAIEDYSSNCRFHMTANAPDHISRAIHSRCETYRLQNLDPEQFILRVIAILDAEGVVYDDDTLSAHITAAKNDLRKCITRLQQHLAQEDGVSRLTMPSVGSAGVADYLPDVVDLWRANRCTDARRLLCSRISVDDFVEVYRWLYGNLDLFGDTEEKQDSALVVIGDGNYRHGIAADPEINLSATLARLAGISRGQ